MIRVAYADPPYVGRSGYYDHDDRRRWDDPAEHVALMTQLEMAFDGWALSCSSPSLRDLLPGAPARARVGVWAKSNPPNYDRVAYGWEPVIFAPGRETGASCRDYLVASAGAYPGRDVGLVGAKPVAFARWLLDLLGYCAGDDLVDLFPGTGVLGRVAAQGRLFEPLS